MRSPWLLSRRFGGDFRKHRLCKLSCDLFAPSSGACNDPWGHNWAVLGSCCALLGVPRATPGLRLGFLAALLRSSWALLAPIPLSIVSASSRALSLGFSWASLRPSPRSLGHLLSFSWALLALRGFSRALLGLGNPSTIARKYVCHAYVHVYVKHAAAIFRARANSATRLTSLAPLAPVRRIGAAEGSHLRAHTLVLAWSNWD